MIARIPVSSSARATVPPHVWDRALHRPVNEFLQRKGKRVRADVITLAYQLAGGNGSVPEALQSFIELLHAGSLIIDDIEDNAVLRRGQAALHRQIGVPLALNTGNWLYFAAFEQLASLPLRPATKNSLLRRSLTTVRKCHEGQALDLATRVDALSPVEIYPTVSDISRLKTGGLVALAAWLGAKLASSAPQVRRAVSGFGMRLGVGLQMQNDLAELKACALEHEVSVDLDNSRVTWPWYWFAQQNSASEFRRLQEINEVKSISRLLWESVAETGAVAVRRKLHGALSRLRRDLGAVAVSHRFAEIVDQLEHHYV